MNEFFEKNHARLSNFSRISKTVGARADYVQGGGGNTSVKLEGGLMAIKASGFCLKDIEVDKAYAVLDYEALRKFYGSAKLSDFEDVEKAGSAQTKEAIKVIDGMPQLRPSVEAGFHSILDTYVAHSHSVYANLATCAKECNAIVEKALAGADYAYGIVEYADPGARLTFSIRDELARVERECGKRPAVIFMKNHGLIVHSDDPDECLRINSDVNERVARAMGITGDAFPAVSVRETDDGLVETDQGFLTEQLATGKYDLHFFMDTPLYPDQMVFLVGTFGIGSGKPEADQCLADIATGRLVFNMKAGRAQVITETLTAVLFIADLLKKQGYTLSTMDDAAKKFIANWESEKYRKSLAGK